MSHESRRMAGILLILFPTVVFGGASLLSQLVGSEEYAQNQLRQDLWRAGHAHAAVLLILSLVLLRYLDEADLPPRVLSATRHAFPLSAILLPAAFFLSVISPDDTEPNAMIYLAYVGAIILVVALATLGVGLLRGHRQGASAPSRE